MRKGSLAWFVAVCLASMFPFAQESAGQNGQGAKPGDAERGSVCLVIPVKGGIGTDFTAQHMLRCLEQAKSLGADTVVLDLDTPGGRTDQAGAIVDLMMANKDIRFVALVRKAISAGVPITMACRSIYVTDSALIGAATSYAENATTGEIVALAPAIEEKMQSIWRGTCRKAAEFGEHPPLLADAMITIDKDSALTMRTEGGKVVLGRGGSGTVLAAKGRILTLTAKEAVACGLAKGVVEDLSGLQAKEAMTGWRIVTAELGQVQRKAPARAGGNTPGAYGEQLFWQLHSLGILDPSLTVLARQMALKEWGLWAGTQRTSRHPLAGAVVLHDAIFIGRGDLVTLRQQLDTAEAELKAERGRKREVRDGAFVWRVRASDKEEIKRLEAKIAQIKEKIVDASYPIQLFALVGDDDRLFVWAWVSAVSGSELARTPKGQTVHLTGYVSNVGLGWTGSGELVPWVEMDRCSVRTQADVLPGQAARDYVNELYGPAQAGAIANRNRDIAEAAASRPGESKEETAATQLKLAENYRANGMTEKAAALLKAIVRDYPETKAGRAAKALSEGTDGAAVEDPKMAAAGKEIDAALAELGKQYPDLAKDEAAQDRWMGVAADLRDEAAAGGKELSIREALRLAAETLTKPPK